MRTLYCHTQGMMPAIRTLKIMIKTLTHLLLMLIVAATLLSCSHNAQQENYTVGIINLNQNLEPVIAAFKKDMALRGYKPGVNITYIYNGALANRQQIDQEVLHMVDSDIDLLFTVTTPVTKKVKVMTKGIDLPVLFAPVFSPVSSGIVDSLARPGGNVTGIKTRGSSAKALEWFVKAIPSIKRIFVPFHYTDKAAIQSLADLQEAAAVLHIELITAKLSNEQELNTILSDIPDDIDAVWLTHSYLIITNTEKIVAAATALKKPVGSSAAGQYKKGLTLSYGPSQEGIGQQAARMADKMLKGVSPAAMPVETADYFLGLNLQNARTLGIKIPDNTISQADFVIR